MNLAEYYLNDPNAPKPNAPTRIGANVLLQWNGQLLLERRSDCGLWGLVGGRLRNGERYTAGIAREVREETGLRLPESAFHQLRVCDDARIAAYRDGTVWRMVIVLFSAILTDPPELQCSNESKELRFFTPPELLLPHIVPTHRDLITTWQHTSPAEI